MGQVRPDDGLEVFDRDLVPWRPDRRRRMPDPDQGPGNGVVAAVETQPVGKRVVADARPCRTPLDSDAFRFLKSLELCHVLHLFLIQELL